MNDQITELSTKLGAALKGRGLMLATAESCTGGGIAEAIIRPRPFSAAPSLVESSVI